MVSNTFWANLTSYFLILFKTILSQTMSKFSEKSSSVFDMTISEACEQVIKRKGNLETVQGRIREGSEKKFSLFFESFQVSNRN